MPAKKKSRVRESSAAKTGGAVSTKVNGSARSNGHLPLRSHAERAIKDYFAGFSNDNDPVEVYELVLREVEEPLLRAVMSHAKGNQSRAAEILGINRATLRKKLRQHGLAA